MAGGRIITGYLSPSIHRLMNGNGLAKEKASHDPAFNRRAGSPFAVFTIDPHPRLRVSGQRRQGKHENAKGKLKDRSEIDGQRVAPNSWATMTAVAMETAACQSRAVTHRRPQYRRSEMECCPLQPIHPHTFLPRPERSFRYPPMLPNRHLQRNCRVHTKTFPSGQPAGRPRHPFEQTFAHKETPPIQCGHLALLYSP